MKGKIEDRKVNITCKKDDVFRTKEEIGVIVTLFWCFLIIMKFYGRCHKEYLYSVYRWLFIIFKLTSYKKCIETNNLVLNTLFVGVCLQIWLSMYHYLSISYKSTLLTELQLFSQQCFVNSDRCSNIRFMQHFYEFCLAPTLRFITEVS